MAERTIEQADFGGGAAAVRAVVGGALMGLANLVPGISGGTMLLAVGIYPQFINGVAEVSTFRLRPKTLLLLGCVVGAAFAAIVSLAGVVSGLVVEQRWIMYSLFIGLTLGGVPVIWRMVRPADAQIVVMSIVGIVLMAVIALTSPGEGGGGGERSYALLLLAGIAGGSAMILPGVSGGYLLLVLGQYEPILNAIRDARAAVSDGDWATASEGLHVFLPVGLGVVIGVVGVSNLVKLLLARFERATMGFLLGLLLGAPIGLWPFQVGEAPAVETFTPSVLQIAGAVGLIAAGFAAASLVARLGNGKTPADG